MSLLHNDSPLGSIGIDFTPATEQTAGIGRYVRELVSALAQIDSSSDYRLFVAGTKSPGDLPLPPGANFAWCPARSSSESLARLWHRARLPVRIEHWTGAIRLFHATDFVLPPTRPTTRTVLTVHDLSFVHLPEVTPARLKRYLDAVVPQSVEKATHVLADSQATKDDLVRIYGTPEDKVTVLLSGVDGRFQPVADSNRLVTVRGKYSLGGWPFLFTVGTVQPRKNYERLCEALALLDLEFPDLHLVIAGGKGWLDTSIFQAIERLRLDHKVHFIGFADDEDLPVLYSAAELVPFVSLYEGFGLPVLEAMACGTPVVAANTSSIPEVAGDAAVLVNPMSVEDIASGISEVLRSIDMQTTLVERGLRQAAEFTWQRAARELHDVYSVLMNR